MSTADVFETVEPWTAPLESAAGDGEPQRRQAAVVALGRRAVAPPNVDLLIQDAAALIAETLAVDHFGVAELDRSDDTISLRFMATDSAGRGEALERQTPFETRNSLAAAALRTAHVIVADDVAADPRFKDRFLREQGIQSALVVPLQLKDQPYGTLGAFSTTRRKFTRDDAMFAEMIAHLVSTTIGRDRTQKALDDERRINRIMLDTVEAIVIYLDPRGRIIGINRACQQATGFTLEELRDRPFWSALSAPENVPSLCELIDRLGTVTQALEQENFIVAKDGQRRRFGWSFAAVRGASGVVESIIGTGIDLTERRAAEAKVSRMEAKRQAHKSTANAAAVPFHPLPAGPRGDRRRQPRRSFEYVQRVAPVVDGQRPSPEMYREVHCQDISSGGFSFVSAEPPQHEDYVVALGTPPVLIHLTAKVAHTTPAYGDPKNGFIIGCEYTGRADY